MLPLSWIYSMVLMKRYIFAHKQLANITMNQNEGGNLAASNIRNLECSSYEVYLIDYGCGKFNKKVHIME